MVGMVERDCDSAEYVVFVDRDHSGRKMPVSAIAENHTCLFDGFFDEGYYDYHTRVL